MATGGFMQGKAAARVVQEVSVMPPRCLATLTNLTEKTRISLRVNALACGGLE